MYPGSQTIATWGINSCVVQLIVSKMGLMLLTREADLVHLQ